MSSPLINIKSQKEFRKELRNNLPPAEAILWNQLKGRQFCGYKFRRQQGIGSYVVDFYCPEASLAVEVDGLSHFSEEQQARDTRRSAFLKEQGIDVVRVVNADVYHDMETVLDRIGRHLPPPPNPSSERRGEEQKKTKP